jgi:hypothetical protein
MKVASTETNRELTSQSCNASYLVRAPKIGRTTGSTQSQNDGRLQAWSRTLTAGWARTTIPSQFEYGKGWWDYVELIRRFAAKFEIEDVRVVGHYVVHTPPPEEKLPMPAVALTRRGVLAALKYDFGALARWPREWTVSIRRPTPYRGQTVGLFDATIDLRNLPVEGLSPDLVFAPYRDNQAEFSCELTDEWDVATLLRLVFHET